MWARSAVGTRTRAKFLRGFARSERLTAPGTGTRHSRWRVPSAVRLEGRCAVRADNAEVLEAVVVSDTVDVVEDERHLASAPRAPLTAELAGRTFNAGLVEALLQVPAAVRRAFDENLIQWFCSAPTCRSSCRVRIKMVCRYSPAFNVPAKRAVITTCSPQSESTERLAVGTRPGDRLRCLRACVRGPSHERMFVSRSDGTDDWGARTRTRT
jgi:hypothetical protein